MTHHSKLASGDAQIQRSLEHDFFALCSANVPCIENIESLIEQGVDISAEKNMGLYLAVCKEHRELAQFIMNHPDFNAHIGYSAIVGMTKDENFSSLIELGFANRLQRPQSLKALSSLNEDDLQINKALLARLDGLPIKSKSQGPSPAASECGVVFQKPQVHNLHFNYDGSPCGVLESPRAIVKSASIDIEHFCAIQ